MNITKNTAVTLQFKISDTAGKLLDQSQEPIAYLHGGYGNTFPKIEEALEGQAAGFATTIELAPADAFGEYNEALLQTIPKTQFPPGVKVGGQLEGRSEDGQSIVFNVVKIKGPVVHLDGNHALAGKTLRFALKVLEVRAASEEEVAHGHVHGAHGHHH
ncbi:FKBP-type peptidyl-prolyl cis-trans isomerase SlyD [Comamonadaceae bacterium OS-4]|nr:FKBP-type peptidyl-prolyl cis-trans isomerase SlyD [Comamonadaceae bacterium OS-4]